MAARRWSRAEGGAAVDSDAAADPSQDVVDALAAVGAAAGPPTDQELAPSAGERGPRR